MNRTARGEQYLERCQELQDISRQLAAAAAAGEWDTVTGLLERRGALMAAVDALQVTPAQLAPGIRVQVRPALAAALESDRSAMDQIVQAMQELRGEMSELYRVRDVLHSYLGSLRPRPQARFLDQRR